MKIKAIILFPTLCLLNTYHYLHYHHCPRSRLSLSLALTTPAAPNACPSKHWPFLLPIHLSCCY